MTARTKRIIRKTAGTGARTVGGVIKLAIRAIALILLIAITTGVIFSCIFVIYAKNNYTGQALDVGLEDFTLNLSSVIY